MPEAPPQIIPDDAGIHSQGPPPAPDRREGDALLDAAANRETLSQPEHDDLVSYYLSNGGLPGDNKVKPLTVTLDGRPFRVEIHPIEWSEQEDAREHATNQQTGAIDAYVSSSWTVARALVTPKLGPTIARLQREDPDNAPADAAELLRRMFRKQSGVLLDLSARVLAISHLTDNSNAVREVEAAKN